MREANSWAKYGREGHFQGSGMVRGGEAFSFRVQVWEGGGHFQGSGLGEEATYKAQLFEGRPLQGLGM